MVGYSPGAVSYAHESVVARVPWYRTRRGLIIVVVVAAIIILTIGTALGVILGGTKK